MRFLVNDRGELVSEQGQTLGRLCEINIEDVDDAFEEAVRDLESVAKRGAMWTIELESDEFGVATLYCEDPNWQAVR